MTNTAYTRRKDRAFEEIIRICETMREPGVTWGNLAEKYAEIERLARPAGLVRYCHEEGIL